MVSSCSTWEKLKDKPNLLFKGLYTPQMFLLLQKPVLFRPKKNSVLLFHKSATHKFVSLTQLFLFFSFFLKEKVSEFRSLHNCLCQRLIYERWLISPYMLFFCRACLFRINLYKEVKVTFIAVIFIGFNLYKFFSKMFIIELYITAIDNYFWLWFFISWLHYCYY